MTADRIKEIQSKTAFPNSISVCQALLQVWNECEQQKKVKKTWEYENLVPVNFKVTSLDKEYLFIHPQEYQRILNELESKIVELEQKIIMQKKVINDAYKLVNDAISKIKQL